MSQETIINIKKTLSSDDIIITGDKELIYAALEDDKYQWYLLTPSQQQDAQTLEDVVTKRKLAYDDISEIHVNGVLISKDPLTIRVSTKYAESNNYVIYYYYEQHESQWLLRKVRKNEYYIFNNGEWHLQDNWIWMSNLTEDELKRFDTKWETLDDSTKIKLLGRTQREEAIASLLGKKREYRPSKAIWPSLLSRKERDETQASREAQSTQASQETQTSRATPEVQETQEPQSTQSTLEPQSTREPQGEQEAKVSKPQGLLGAQKAKSKKRNIEQVMSQPLDPNITQITHVTQKPQNDKPKTKSPKIIAYGINNTPNKEFVTKGFAVPDSIRKKRQQAEIKETNNRQQEVKNNTTPTPPTPNDDHNENTGLEVEDYNEATENIPHPTRQVAQPKVRANNPNNKKESAQK